MVEKIKNTWFLLHRHMLSKIALYLVMGAVLGIVGNRIWEHVFPPGPPVIKEYEAPVVQQFGDYFGVYVDRTRTRLCQVSATQIIFRRVDYQGRQLDLVLPLPETGVYWPVIGHATYIRLIHKPAGLLPGIWMTQTISSEQCTLWDTLFGGRFSESHPVPININ